MVQLSPQAARMCRMLCSAVIAGAMGVGSNLLTAINASGEVQKGSLTVAIITGIMLTLKDIQAYLSQPPGD